MNKESLQDIERRAAEATAGPFNEVRWDDGRGELFENKIGSHGIVATIHGAGNREFYFRARADCLTLCAALRETAQLAAEPGAPGVTLSREDLRGELTDLADRAAPEHRLLASLLLTLAASISAGSEEEFAAAIRPFRDGQLRRIESRRN